MGVFFMSKASAKHSTSQYSNVLLVMEEGGADNGSANSWNFFNSVSNILKRALQCYKQALDILERRELNTGICDAIVWDYTSVLFNSRLFVTRLCTA
ncbi:hypothetical protein DAPPUDRAFT_265008 [Daphnia pulex]|uniref:Uncharacterized protein n=1 Tax=Daphnia pulex TaxID=6669 RepID=E9HSQ4_DAPPU|nr:hypothetical protein DAPPUDRAFT_274420 [Daphnia pulex]EFX65234.1 hypothetical protein DAPPUDRAFT_265008 [Daphnia pulex]|eukprot:EFX61207.1 hypothetical protein DAPPUDRAFT_274420 [Daphnia pulex]